MAARDRAALAELLAAKEMVVVCGSGGTGKTTIAAALGAQAAATVGGRVLVLTVDPARRLATALGVGQLGNSEVRVPDDAFSAAGVKPRGEMWVAMLDTKAGWDELVRRHAPDAKLREQVLANPLYRNITSRFVHSHDYIAMERLQELHASGRYDLVIIDTPPSRNALDLLDAPGRMRDFFGSRLLRWLTVPYRSRLFTMASKPFYQVADRVLGSRFLQDIAEFFILFQAMEPGFVAPREGGRAAAHGSAHDVRGRLDAGGGARPRGPVPRHRARTAADAARCARAQPHAAGEHPRHGGHEGGQRAAASPPTTGG